MAQRAAPSRLTAQLSSTLSQKTRLLCRAPALAMSALAIRAVHTNQRVTIPWRPVKLTVQVVKRPRHAYTNTSWTKQFQHHYQIGLRGRAASQRALQVAHLKLALK